MTDKLPTLKLPLRLTYNRKKDGSHGVPLYWLVMFNKQTGENSDFLSAVTVFDKDDNLLHYAVIATAENQYMPDSVIYTCDNPVSLKKFLLGFLMVSAKLSIAANGDDDNFGSLIIANNEKFDKTKPLKPIAPSQFWNIETNEEVQEAIDFFGAVVESNRKTETE